MNKLIINADDFGYCEAVNYGIVSAHNNGVVTSTTIMANMPGFEHALDLLKKNPTLGCGVHMTLSCYKPLLEDVKSLTDEDGFFFRRINEDVLNKIDLDELYKEFCAQIEKVKSAGIKITHLDSHHHVHTIPYLEEVIKKIVEKYSLPIRGGFKYSFKYEKVVPCIGDFYKDNVDKSYFKDNLNRIKSYEVVDLMTHPAFLDSYILNSTSYAYDRTKEHEILSDYKLKVFLEENGVELTNYNKL